MSYLSDNLPLGVTTAECPELYPYALVVEWVVLDPFFYPGPVAQIAGAVHAALPDVEVWQYSVLRTRQNRMKLRFRTPGERILAREALTTMDPSFQIRRVVDMNPPDRPVRGIP